MTDHTQTDTYKRVSADYRLVKPAGESEGSEILFSTPEVRTTNFDFAALLEDFIDSFDAAAVELAQSVTGTGWTLTRTDIWHDTGSYDTEPVELEF